MGPNDNCVGGSGALRQPAGPRHYLVLGQVARGAAHVALAHEEQQVVAVDGLLLLEEEVPHEQVRPVRRALQHHEPRICRRTIKFRSEYS